MKLVSEYENKRSDTNFIGLTYQRDMDDMMAASFSDITTQAQRVYYNLYISDYTDDNIYYMRYVIPLQND